MFLLLLLLEVHQTYLLKPNKILTVKLQLKAEPRLYFTRQVWPHF